MQEIREWRGVENYLDDAVAERALLRAARAGDRAALQRLFAPHERALGQLCRGMLDHQDDAEDAAQETFLRALRALPRFRGDAAIRTWLFRIAVNVCLEWRRARRPAAPLREAERALPPDASCPEAVALRHLRVLEALRALPPRHRAMLLLKEWEGWSVAEIAAALRCTARRVYHELGLAHRALADWRRLHADEARAEEGE